MRRCLDPAAAGEALWQLTSASESSSTYRPPRQIAVGAADDQSSRADTSAEHHGCLGEIDFSFLLPSTKPGSLGRLGHYEIEVVLGRGGCSIVLKAFHEMLPRLEFGDGGCQRSYELWCLPKGATDGD